MLPADLRRSQFDPEKSMPVTRGSVAELLTCSSPARWVHTGRRSAGSERVCLRLCEQGTYELLFRASLQDRRTPPSSLGRSQASRSERRCSNTLIAACARGCSKGDPSAG